MCPPLTTAQDEAGAQAKYMNLKKDKFSWPRADTGTDTGTDAGDPLGPLLALILSRVESLASLFLAEGRTGTGTGTGGGGGEGAGTEGSAGAPRCLTVTFVQQQASLFRPLEGWLREVVGALKQRVLVVLTAAGGGSSKDGKATADDALSEKEMRNVNFKFNTRRSLNLANYASIKRQKLGENVMFVSTDSDLSGGHLVIGGGSLSGGPFESLAAALSAVERQHRVHVEPVSAAASATVTEAALQYLQLTASLPVPLTSTAQISSPQEYERVKCRVDIAVDEESIPLYASICLMANDSNDVSPKAAGLKTPIAQTPAEAVSRFQMPERGSVLLSVYQQMNEFLAAERERERERERAVHDLSKCPRSSAEKIAVTAAILSRFIAHFKLLSSSGASGNSGASGSGDSSGSSLCQTQPQKTLTSSLRVSPHTGQISVDVMY